MASDQQFCLRWNNHQSTLVSVFDNLLESQTLVDCTLAADGQYLKAHKVVLSACSPYLEAILCQNLDKHPILILKDVKFSELKAMLDYMYRGEVNISQEQLSTFLKAAESLQIKGLTDSGGGGNSERDRDLLKRQDLRKPQNQQPVPHIPQPRPVVPHPGLMERRSLPHFPPHIADMQPQSPRHAREGSTSPTARKRRRPNRPSSDDSNFVSTPNSLSENQPDTSDSCDIPVKQAVSSTPNVPNASTKAPETDSPRTTPQPQNNQNSEQKQQVTVKKEFSETLLTPKTEFDYGNDNSMEDVTYEDDEEEEVDLSKPGTSFAANSQGFPPWQMGGDGSNDDSNNMYSPDVTATTNQNNSQDGGFLNIPENSPRAEEKLNINGVRHTKSNVPNSNGLTPDKNTTYFLNEIVSEFSKNSELKSIENSPVKSPEKGMNKPGGLRGKRVICSKCGEHILKRLIRLHKKYFCGTQFDEKEWKVARSHPLCLQCNKTQDPDSIEFHVKYICDKKPITVQCFYCPRLFVDYKGLLKHMNLSHKKRHYYLDLMSILPVADPSGAEHIAPKVVKNFFSNMLNTEHEAFVEENESSASPCVQLRQKSNHKCDSCGKILLGTHEYVNHVNTKCESENYYSCFYCSFNTELAYVALDHMEEIHGKFCNTFDLIQARLTGIIPLMENSAVESFSENYNGYSAKQSVTPDEQIKSNQVNQCSDNKAQINFKSILNSSSKPLPSNLLSDSTDDEQDFEINNDINNQPIEPDTIPNEALTIKDEHFKRENKVSLEYTSLENDDFAHRNQDKLIPKVLNVLDATIQQGTFEPVGSVLDDSLSVDTNPMSKEGWLINPEVNPSDLYPQNGSNSLASETYSSDKVQLNASPTKDSTQTQNSKQIGPTNIKSKIELAEKSLPEKNFFCEKMVDKSSPENAILNSFGDVFTSPIEKSQLTDPQNGINCEKELTKTELPKTNHIHDGSGVSEDPELDFANKELFQPFHSPSLRSISTQGNKSKNNRSKIDMCSSSKSDNSVESDTLRTMSLDSEVDFANKYLFEPYITPKKELKSLRSQMSKSTIKECPPTLRKEIRSVNRSLKISPKVSKSEVPKNTMRN